MQAHVSTCSECQEQLRELATVKESLALFPTEITRTGSPLWERLSARIAAEEGTLPLRIEAPERRDPEWEDVAPGIHCKFLSTDHAGRRVSMLVRLEAGVNYPPHTHAGVEELYLLAGKLWINDRELHAGDYNRADPGSLDARVWTETGCTGLLITSLEDKII